MDCNEARQKISLQVDHELLESAEKPLEEHLSRCAACLAYRDELQRLRGFFQAEEVPAPTPLLRDRVLAAGRQELGLARRGRMLQLSRRLAIAALFLAALTVGIFSLGSSNQVQAEDSDKDLHYEDLFQTDGRYGEAMLKALIKTDNPREAMKIYQTQNSSQKQRSR